MNWMWELHYQISVSWKCVRSFRFCSGKYQFAIWCHRGTALREGFSWWTQKPS